MKTTILANLFSLAHGPRVRHRTAALLAGLALGAGIPCCLNGQSPPEIAIEKSVLLSWPENTAEEQIVVGASSLASNAVWNPWPEPIFKRQGQLCMAVPITSAQQYFKLVPGTQFSDGFSDPQGPSASRKPYQLTWQHPSGEDIWVTNGVLRIACQGEVGGVFIQPPEPGMAVRDFHASVDILDWVASGTNWSAISIGARMVVFDEGDGVGYGDGYFGGLVLNKDGTTVKATPTIGHGSSQKWGSAFDFEATASYRLEFSGVDTHLLVRVLDQRTRQVIQEIRLTDSTFRKGLVGIYEKLAYEPTASHAITLDNFFVTGTKP